MATNSDDMQNLLSCTICLETFKVPKYLPCLHTFCESCIGGLIIASDEKGRTSDFSCPVCRRSVKLDDFKGNVETWTKTLPVNHLIVSMIDREAIRKSEKLCDSCQFNMETVKAVSWCNACEEGLCRSCEKCHRSFKISSKHLIIPIDDVTKINKTTVDIGGINECSEHPGKTIEVYCEDHSKPCCTLCATLIHRKCESVISIEAAATGIKQSTKATELAEKLNEKSTNIGEMIKNRKDGIRVVENETSTTLTNVDEIKDTVVKHVNEIADQFKERVTSSKKNTVVTLSDEATELSSFKCTVDNWQIIFDTCLQQASEQQCLVEMERITQKYIDLENDMKVVMSKLTNPNISFKPNKIISEFQTNVETFGDFSLEILTTNTAREKPKVNFHAGKINVLNTIEIDVNKSGCRQISGMFVNDFIVLTDYLNKRIVKYDENYTYLASLSLPTNVSDITHMEKDTVAVASAYSVNIYIIDTKVMTLTKTITAPTTIYGLQYVDGHFIAARNGTLTWISELGEKLKELKTNGDTFFICPAGKNSYICADGINSVSITQDENKTFTYTKQTLQYARGVDVDFEGNIYIVGFKSGNIHQLTNAGEHIRTISTKDFGHEKPWILRFKPNSDTFLLTSYDTGRVLICNID